jgi:CHAT domain-containing protein/tetratricopeptide (TPR) repeat protein
MYSGMKPPFIGLLLLIASLLGTFDLQAQDAGDWLRQAEVALQQGRTDRAFQLLARAMHQAREDRQTANYLAAANSIARLGLDRKSNYDSAFALAQDAARSVAFSARDTSLASLYYKLARFHDLAARSTDAARHASEAIHYYNKALSIFEATGGESLQVANCLYGLADVNKYTIFNYQLAEEYYERALGIRERLHLTDTVTLFGNYYGLAATNRSQQDYEKAIAYGTVAIALSQSLDKTRQEFANSMIGNIYRDMGNSTEAIRSYKLALTLNESTKDATARASHFQNMAQTMQQDSLYDEALRYYNEAEKLYRSMNNRDERLFIHMLTRKTAVLNEKGDSLNFKKAVAVVFTELKRTGLSRSSLAAETHLMIAEFKARRQKYYTAVDDCQKALIASVPQFNSMDTETNPSMTMIGTNFNTGEILARKGEYLSRLYRATKRKAYADEALECLYLAEQLLSQERNTLDTEDAKWAFLDTKYTVYESIIASLYESWADDHQEDALTQAYQFFERSKARSLSDALAGAEQARLIGADDSLLHLHGQLKAEEFSIENRMSDLIAKSNSQADISRLREQLVTLDRQLQQCTHAIEEKYPGYFNAKYGQILNPLPDVRDLARAEHRVVLEYFWGAEWVYGLGISADSVLFVRIGRSEDIRRDITRMLVHFQDEHAGSSLPVFQSFATSAHALYSKLVRPFETLLGHASLQIIPDGQINLVPFDILVTSMPEISVVDYRNLDYLLKSRATGYAYSTAMLKNNNRQPVSNPSLLAVGFTGGQRERAGDDMIPLQEIEGAEKELEALSVRFRNGRFLRDRAATESNFKRMSPQYDIIHLAIHGRGDLSNNFSASLFFRSAYDTIDDGVFHAYELYGLKLKALMAVLSACESGIGRDYRGEGMISMASAFTSAGCENTLMSLWKVNDQASIRLMDDFYQQLLRGAPIDEALRKAKLNYLEQSDELTADPKSWAPLVAYGSLHQVFETDRRSPFVYLVLALAAIVLGVGVSYFRQRRRYSAGG